MNEPVVVPRQLPTAPRPFVGRQDELDRLATLSTGFPVGQSTESDPSGSPGGGTVRHVLEQLANECHEVGEPPMTALVVNAQTGAPGAGWHGNGEPWHADVQRVFRYWAAQS